LLDHAVAKSDECSPRSENDIRSCARDIVRDNICICCRSDETIIETITDEFIKQMKTVSQNSCADDLALFKKEKSHGQCSCSSGSKNETVTIAVRTRPGK